MNKLTSKFYLVGIKGNGMSSLACILYDLGYEVIGSDVTNHFFTENALLNKSIITLCFDESNINGDAIYIIGMAFSHDNNVEVEKILKNGYKYFYYNEFINEFFNGIKIGVSGSHGKSTVTSMVSHFMNNKGICSLVGDSSGYGMHNYKYFIFEACEYKNTFHKYKYDYLIINNIDYDHVDFFNDINDVIASFQIAGNNAKCLIINNDCPNSSKINHHNKVTFGKNINSDIVIKKIEEERDSVNVEYIYKEKKYNFKLPFVGEYNVYNFTACLCILLMENNMEDIQEKLNCYKFPKRRMEISYYKSNILIDDYAHHPSEIKALLNSVKKKYWDKKIVTIFQPHTYSRTLKLAEGFKDCFEDADESYYVETYRAREEYDEIKEREVDEVLCECMKIEICQLKNFKRFEDSVILFVGAGVISSADIFDRKI